MRLLLACLLVALPSAVPAAAAAQSPSTDVIIVRLRDGSQIFGTVVSEDATQLVLKTVSGADVTVPRAQVASMKATSGRVVGSEFWEDDVVDSKLFLGPTGRSLKRGTGYFAIDSLFLPVFQIGVTDRFSVGGGLPFYGALGSGWVTPKLQVYESGRTSISTGVLHILAPDFGIGGFGYVVTTHGSRDAAVTFGGGLLYGRDDESGETSPMLTIGGERRVSRRAKFITENYLFRGGAAVTAGTRIVGRNVTGEIGAILLVGEGTIPGVFFNFVFHPRPGR